MAMLITWYALKADKCHIPHVVADTDSREQKMTQALEEIPRSCAAGRIS